MTFAKAMGFTVAWALGIILAAPATAAAQQCTSIKDGTITDSAGQPIQPGYDQWGYNYQARAYNGIYDNFTRPATPWDESTCTGAPNGCTSLEMKWNDPWLSNKDCNSDARLDRASDPPSGTYKESGAWLTNHMSGSCLTSDGHEKHWTYFVKILAVPADATASDGYYYGADGKVIGQAIWGDFAVVQEVTNDPCEAVHGLTYKAVHPGMGTQKP